MRAEAVHLSLPASFGRGARELAVHRTSLPRRDVIVVDGIRCTNATRTLLDCAALVPDEALEAAFEHARRMGLTTPAALARRAEELAGRGRPGAARVRRLLVAQAAGGRAMESRLDFAWPAARVACECDGFEHHGSRLAWKRHRARLAALEAAGWRIVRVTWDDVARRPAQTLARLALALRGVAA